MRKRKIIRYPDRLIATTEDGRPSSDDIRAILEETPDVAIYVKNSPLLIFINGKFSHTGELWAPDIWAEHLSQDEIRALLCLRALKTNEYVSAVKLVSKLWPYLPEDPINITSKGIEWTRNKKDNVKRIYAKLIEKSLKKLDGYVTRSDNAFRLEPDFQD